MYRHKTRRNPGAIPSRALNLSQEEGRTHRYTHYAGPIGNRLTRSIGALMRTLPILRLPLSVDRNVARYTAPAIDTGTWDWKYLI